MSKIKSKNTKPELLFRSGIHRLGFRFLIHDKRLPGKPDLVFPKYKAVVFVQGCFWHGHSCPLYKLPSTRTGFWKEKIERNRQLDKKNIEDLQNSGWRICMLWECSIKGKGKHPYEDVFKNAALWLKSNNRFFEIRGIN